MGDYFAISQTKYSGIFFEGGIMNHSFPVRNGIAFRALVLLVWATPFISSDAIGGLFMTKAEKSALEKIQSIHSQVVNQDYPNTLRAVDDFDTLMNQLKSQGYKIEDVSEKKKRVYGETLSLIQSKAEKSLSGYLASIDDEIRNIPESEQRLEDIKDDVDVISFRYDEYLTEESKVLHADIKNRLWHENEMIHQKIAERRCSPYWKSVPHSLLNGIIVGHHQSQIAYSISIKQFVCEVNQQDNVSGVNPTEPKNNKFNLFINTGESESVVMGFSKLKSDLWSLTDYKDSRQGNLEMTDTEKTQMLILLGGFPKY